MTLDDRRSDDTGLDSSAASTDAALVAANRAELLGLASYAPFALFVDVALADGVVAEEEQRAFVGQLFEGDGLHPLIREMVTASVLGPTERIQRLASDPQLGGRALAAAGALFSTHPDGAEARAAFEGLGLSIAQADGIVTDAERQVLATLLASLDAGPAAAMTADDAGVWGGVSRETATLASFAPYAAFLMVAGADGELEPEEIGTFEARVDSEPDPLLKALLNLGPLTHQERFERLSADPELEKSALEAATVVFATAPGGGAARNALMGLLHAIAAADGAVDPDERLALEALGGVFDENIRVPDRPVPWIAVLLVVGMLGGALLWAVT